MGTLDGFVECDGNVLETAVAEATENQSGLARPGTGGQRLVICAQVGGLWVLNSDSGRAAAYESLRINTSKQMTSFHDFRMPRSYPTFATREQVI